MVEIVACTTCWTHFFGQALAMWPSFPQYKQRLFTRRHCFLCFMPSLNRVLLICMGSSLGVNTICLGYNMGGVNCVNVGYSSQCLSCRHSKSRLSKRTPCAITWFKVVGSSMVNRRSFTSPRSLNENWLMNTALSHEMSHINCLNLEAYIEIGCDSWWKVRNLLVVVHSLFESLKEAPKSPINASKWFRRGDCCSKRGVNHAKVVLDNKVPMNPTWVRSFW